MRIEQERWNIGEVTGRSYFWTSRPTSNNITSMIHDPNLCELSQEWRVMSDDWRVQVHEKTFLCATSRTKRHCENSLPPTFFKKAGWNNWKSFRLYRTRAKASLISECSESYPHVSKISLHRQRQNLTSTLPYDVANSCVAAVRIVRKLRSKISVEHHPWRRR